jgi:tetratricopeptide (TPR) repeat protein
MLKMIIPYALAALSLFFISSSSLLAEDKDRTLDNLFNALKGSSVEHEARKYEQEIWKTWLKSDNPEVNDLMQQALRKREVYDFNGALEILNKIIKIKPEYPEVWNQRATVYFHQGALEKSLIDIARTLELEPRHFGSLAGRAVIRLQQGKPALARQNIIEASRFHPFLKERAFFPDLETWNQE